MNIVCPSTVPGIAGRTRTTGAATAMRAGGLTGRWNRCGNRAVDSRQGRFDLEPFWPSRQPHLFDQTCPGSPSASRLSAR
ncbi:hypothetical protein BU198_19640 [Streptomyces sp. CBMA156]|nr:hypothetical protein [Streptomyces sp. CBMA156]